jgi:hypothetical protein
MRKMQKGKLTSKQRNQVQAWDRFCLEENGAIPATIAAWKLGMSSAGLYQAAERGWIKFFKVGRDRWYGAKSISRYRAKRESGGNWLPFRASEPRDCSENGTDKHGEWSPIEK